MKRIHCCAPESRPSGRAATRRRRRRGMAMLLVLITLATATILTMSYLASRDNSTQIGRNISSAASARWAALSGLELGVAVLETEQDWRTGHDNGYIAQSYPLGDATLDLQVHDLTTGDPPDESTTDVQLISTATASGVTQIAIAIATVPPADADDTIDIDLSEFAIFAEYSITLENEATLARWPAAPLSDLGRRIAVATRGKDANLVEVRDSAATIDTTLYYGTGASGSLARVESGPVVAEVELGDDVPVPRPPDPGIAPPRSTDDDGDVERQDASWTVDSDARVQSVRMDRSRLAVSGDVRLVVNEDVRLDDGSRILFQDNATVVVFGDLRLDDSSIEIDDDATLTFYIGGELELDDSYLGDQRDNESVRDASGNASYMDPERLRVYSVDLEYLRSQYESAGDASLLGGVLDLLDAITDPLIPSARWRVRNNSVVKGSLYAPTVGFELEGVSALYGRVAAKHVRVSNQCAIYYDPALDSRMGYSNPDSPLFEGDGTIKSDVLALSSLDDASLLSLADSLNLQVRNRDRTYGTSGSVTVDPGPGQPTPRTVPVDYDITAVGTTPDDWEL